MRYLSAFDIESNLRQGRSVEQLLSGGNEDGVSVVRFVRIDREPDSAYSVTLFEVLGDGKESFLDIYEFSALDPDLPFGRSKSFHSIEDALKFSCEELSADIGRFVNSGVAQDEYRDRYHPE